MKICFVLFGYILSLFENNPKDLDPSYELVLDLWNCLRRKITSYNRINTVFIHLFIYLQLLGFVLVVLGFILRFGRALYEPFLQTGIDAIKKVVTDTPLANFDTNNLDLGNVVQALAIGLIVGGLFLCCISFIGCCGACYKIDCLLWLVSTRLYSQLSISQSQSWSRTSDIAKVNFLGPENLLLSYQ